MLKDPPDWLQEWSEMVGADLKDGLREGPSWIAFARDNETVYHTYTVMAPDPFVAPYHAFLQDRTPKEPQDPFRIWRKDGTRTERASGLHWADAATFSTR